MRINYVALTIIGALIIWSLLTLELTSSILVTMVLIMGIIFSMKDD